MFNLATGILLIQFIVAAIAALAAKKKNYRVAEWMACGFLTIAAFMAVGLTVNILKQDVVAPDRWLLQAAFTAAISMGSVFGIIWRTRWLLAAGAAYLFAIGVGYSVFNWFRNSLRFGSFHAEVFLQWSSLLFFLPPILMNLAMAWVLWSMFQWIPDGGRAS